MNINRTLTELVKISNTVGKDSSLVLGGFGNTSVKTADGKYMYIKASGTALKDMTSRRGWRRIKVDSVLTMLTDKSLSRMDIDERETRVTNALLSACDDKSKAGRRPSIESGFHSILDRCVIHLHPAAVLAYACAKNGRAELQKLFRKEKSPPLWVPYADPGYKLAKRIERLTRNYKSQYGRGPAVMFLQNHGLLVSSNNSGTALRLVRKAVNTCKSKLYPAPARGGVKQPKSVKIKPLNKDAITEAVVAIRKAFSQTTGKHMTVKHFIDENITRFMVRRDAAQLCSVPALTPDELIYSHGPAMWLEKPSQQTLLNRLNRRITKAQQPPAAFLIKPFGLFVAGRKSQLTLVKDVVSTSLAIRSFAARLGGARPLSKRQREFIAKLASKSCG